MDLEVKISRSTIRKAYMLLKYIELHHRDVLDKDRFDRLIGTLHELKRVLKETEQP